MCKCAGIANHEFRGKTDDLLTGKHVGRARCEFRVKLTITLEVSHVYTPTTPTEAKNTEQLCQHSYENLARMQRMLSASTH